MKNLTLFVSIMLLSGCGVSQKQLKDANELLTVAQRADCDTIKQYLGLAQREIQKKIK